MSLNVELLEQSFEKIKPCANEFVASFYENLFAAYPELMPLFTHTDMEKQNKKLLNSLILVVENLRNPDVLATVLSSLGARHISYGAIPQYYPVVGKILLLTFEQYLKNDWTPEIKEAWTTAYTAIASQMLKGVENVEIPKDRSQLETISPPPTPVAETPQIPLTDISSQTTLEETSIVQISELPVDILQKSFDKIKPRAEEFAASFYENLFQENPEIKPMFAHVEMSQQYKKLLSALVLVIESLRNPSVLPPVLSALGSRHVGYGTLPQQYPMVGKALLLTLQQYLPDDWTPELNKAWKNAYAAIVAQMLQGIPQKSASKLSENTNHKTSVKNPNLQEVNPEKIEFTTSFLARFKDLQKTVSQPQLHNLPKRILRSALESFWVAPVWLVAMIAVIIWLGILGIADENPLIAEFIEGADTISLILALVLFIKETPDRRKQFHYQAWGTIDAAQNVKVSYARILALQDLNADGVSLRGLDCPGAELLDINLTHANLSKANLTESDLTNTNLSHANLDNANLSNTKLSNANLSHANLGFANLTKANLSSANLSNANLICADLSGANLSGANLKNASLSGANLTQSYLTGANLQGAKISISELQTAFLEGARMPDGSIYHSQN